MTSCTIPTVNFETRLPHLCFRTHTVETGGWTPLLLPSFSGHSRLDPIVRRPLPPMDSLVHRPLERLSRPIQMFLSLSDW